MIGSPSSGAAAAREWHYDMRGEARGPVSADAIRAKHAILTDRY